MKKTLLVVVFILFAVGSIALQFKRSEEPTKPSTPKPDILYTQYTHPLLFFDQKLFDAGMLYVKNNPPQSSSISPIHGGIIPHHLLASQLLSDFFGRIKDQPIDTIILIGPNHKEVGNGKVLSSLGAWETPQGKVFVNGEVIKQLQAEGMLQLNDEVLTNEHSVGGIMPYIKQYLPQTKVFPIILSGKLTAEETETLANALMKVADEHTLIIASVDFSHYLPSKIAEQKDQETRKLMENFEIEKLHKLNNDYVDSPPSIALMLHIIEKKYEKKFEILNNSNSGQILRDENVPTTSYFEIVF